MKETTSSSVDSSGGAKPAESSFEVLVLVIRFISGSFKCNGAPHNEQHARCHHLPNPTFSSKSVHFLTSSLAQEGQEEKGALIFQTQLIKYVRCECF